MNETTGLSPDLLDERKFVRYLRDEEEFARVRVNDAKAMYLQSVYRSSPENVQPNWGRIMIHEIEGATIGSGGLTSVLAQLLHQCAGFVTVDVSSAEIERSPVSFVKRATRLDELGQTDSALDLLYDSIDGMIRNGKLRELDSILAMIREDDFSVDMLLGFLTATLPARNRLGSRKDLVKRVARSIRHRGEWEDGLLTGL